MDNSKQEVRHTATPWVLRKNGVIVGGPVRQYVNGSAQDQIVMACATDEDNGSQIANAEFIVRACNSHEQLVVALKDCVSVMERELSGLTVIQSELRQARAALASAGAV